MNRMKNGRAISLVVVAFALLFVVGSLFAQDSDIPVVSGATSNISGRVWHDLDVSRDDLFTADDKQLAGVVVNLMAVDNTIEFRGETILTLSDDSFSIKQYRGIVDQSGNEIDMEGNIMVSYSQSIGNIFNKPGNPPYYINEQGVIFADISSHDPLGSVFHGGFDLVSSTVTDENGFYTFASELTVGQYVITVDVDTLPADKAHHRIGLATTETDGIPDQLQSITITETYSTYTDINFSYVAADFADLPHSYSTTGGGSPAHILVPADEQIMLGDFVTADQGGQPTFFGDGDIDEGFTWLEYTRFRYGETTAFNIDVTGNIPSEGAILGVWFDWNHDGIFSESEFIAYNVREGTVTIPVTVPDDYVPGKLGARFRLFAGDNLPGGEVDWTDYEGSAINGEVEDYVFVSTGDEQSIHDYYKYYDDEGTPMPTYTPSPTPTSTPGQNAQFTHDFGDLPESYATQSDNPPAHEIVTGRDRIVLGTTTTTEASRQSDDYDDGVVARSLFRAGQTQTVRVTVSGYIPTRYTLLGTWLDWNGDEQFTEDEFFAHNVHTGLNSIPVTPPDDFNLDSFAARFRLFSTEHLPGGTLDWEDYEGSVVNGEVEDYIFRAYVNPPTPTPAKDFGDLPDSFSTTGEGAPSHQLVSEDEQIMLGNAITDEEDGQPSSSTDADSDDGVELPNCQFMAGETPLFNVEVTGNIPPEGAILGVWLDWNHDLVFDETEFLAFNVVEGVNVIPVTAPDNYQPDTSAVRFRLFAGNNLPDDTVGWTDYEGAAINGEVEDYILVFALANSCDYYSFPSPTPAPAKDFGDLPDSFSTTGEGAPSHQLVSEEEQIILGNEITAESDGQPDANAVGDFDDGVLPPSRFIGPGATHVFEVTVSGNVSETSSLPLGIWLDWNMDEQFTEDEFLAFNVTQGVNFIPITAPEFLDEGYFSARFRLFDPNHIPGGTLDWEDYQGATLNGEVEDYLVWGYYDSDYDYEATPSPTPTPAKDFGDLPNTFSTTGEGAPSHQLVSEEEQIMLGAQITVEEDGQPHPTVSKDADDGITLPPVQFYAGGTYMFDVEVTGNVPPEGAILGIWTDWDHSGNFTEEEFFQVNVTEGTTTIPVTVPDGFSSNTTAMRFRLFAGDNLPDWGVNWVDYEGEVINGEVEDYAILGWPSAVTLQTPSTPSPSKVNLIIASITLLLLIQMMQAAHIRKTVP